ncbi:MAG: HepT-like ribonuclease domain-containing protein [Ignavibacteriaceae bacterium]
MRNQIEWIKDIFDAIVQIEKYSLKGEDVFQKDELIQTWMVHHLQLIGEAANKVSGDITKKYRMIPWAQIKGLRNIIVHEYFGIDLEEIWNTVIIDIPKLKKNITLIISDLEKSQII